MFLRIGNSLLENRMVFKIMKHCWLGLSYKYYSHVIVLICCVFAVISVCKKLKDQVLVLNAPIRGVAPMLSAIRKLQTSSEHLTSLHPEFLLLCLLAKCYKTGLSVLHEDIFEVDQPKDLFLYGYYGWASSSSSSLFTAGKRKKNVYKDPFPCCLMLWICRHLSFATAFFFPLFFCFFRNFCSRLIHIGYSFIY